VGKFNVQQSDEKEVGLRDEMVCNKMIGDIIDFLPITTHSQKDRTHPH
jgi:hypothetical protein